MTNRYPQFRIDLLSRADGATWRPHGWGPRTRIFQGRHGRRMAELEALATSASYATPARVMWRQRAGDWSPWGPVKVATVREFDDPAAAKGEI